MSDASARSGVGGCSVPGRRGVARAVGILDCGGQCVGFVLRKRLVCVSVGSKYHALLAMGFGSGGLTAIDPDRVGVVDSN